MKYKIFGECISFIYTIEFQKRGWPHAHILITLKSGFKIETTDYINRFISATIPDKNKDPELYKLVVRHMLHSPCGARYPAAKCMSNGKCSKLFPQEFREETVLSDARGRPGYKRPQNGVQAVKGQHTYDNSRVVPYNAFLLKKMNCHINLEACPTYRCIKYIFKYIFKGFDCLTLQSFMVDGKCIYDEISNYIGCRYMSACEAICKLIQMKFHFNKHSVVLLSVHLPNHQNVTFMIHEEEEAIERAKRSTLMAMFLLNSGPHAALSKTLLYQELPSHFTWDKSERE
jgi:hypothetical protein